jgi:hypothetical protein
MRGLFPLREFQFSKQLAYRQNDPIKIAYAKTQLGFVRLSSGMFKEALESLSSKNKSVIATEELEKKVMEIHAQ